MIITINSTSVLIDDGRFIKGNPKEVSYDYDSSAKTMIFFENTRLLASGLINTITVNGVRLNETNYKEVLKDLFVVFGGGGNGSVDTSNFLLKDDKGVSQGSVNIHASNFNTTATGNINMISESTAGFSQFKSTPLLLEHTASDGTNNTVISLTKSGIEIKSKDSANTDHLNLNAEGLSIDAKKIELHATTGGNLSLHSEGNMSVLSTGNIVQTTSATNTTIANSIVNTVGGRSLRFDSVGLEVDANIYLLNNLYLKGKTASGVTDHNLIGKNSSGYAVVGDSRSFTYIYGSGLYYNNGTNSYTIYHAGNINTVTDELERQIEELRQKIEALGG